jgi:ribulose-phosphate 3-epimerase
VAINPGTPWNQVQEVLEEADLILIMTVNPGFGGQKFIAGMLPKVRALREEIERRGLPAEIEVDGGISRDTAAQVVAAGARVLVAGTSVYGVDCGVPSAVAILRQAGCSGLSTSADLRH